MRTKKEQEADAQRRAALTVAPEPALEALADWLVGDAAVEIERERAEINARRQGIGSNQGD
jgi:hypothetical protein